MLVPSVLRSTFRNGGGLPRSSSLAPDGTVVARDGDTIKLGGPDYMHVCRVQSVEY